MRCMACGGEMVLTAVKPDDAGIVAGFKHETLQCSVCQDIERRFVFGRGSNEKPDLPAASAFPQQPIVCFSAVEAIPSIPQGISSSALNSSSMHEESASTWIRAVKKLRSRQADIRVRADDEKNDWNARFNQILEKLAAPRKPPTAGGATPQRLEQIARKSARALRAELSGPSPAGDRAEQAIIEPRIEEIQRFNRFWDSLLPARHRSDLPAEVTTELSEPLPRSLSPVQIENFEDLSIAAHAILLLRGLKVPR